MSIRCRALLCGLLCVLGTACGEDGGSPKPIVVNGSERLEWDQRAASAADLPRHTFTVHVDGQPQPLADVRCAPAVGESIFPCSGRLPAMSNGIHALQLVAAFEGRSSAPSERILVDVRGASPASATLPSASMAADPGRGAALCLSDGAWCYSASVVADGLDAPSALSATPEDDLLFFVEAGRQVRVIEHGVLVPEPALAAEDLTRIVGLAVDRDFATTRAAFVALTEVRNGRHELTVRRYRALAGRLAEGAPIVSGLPLPADAITPLAMGADRLLYLAMPGSAAEGRGADAAYSGFILRFDRDGRVPAQNRVASPVIAQGYERPAGLAIDEANRLALTGARRQWNHVAAGAAPGEDGQDWPAVAHGWIEQPSSGAAPAGVTVAFVAGTTRALVTVDGSLRAIVPAGDGRLARTEPVTWNLGGQVEAVAAAPERAVLYATVTNDSTRYRIVRLVKTSE